MKHIDPATNTVTNSHRQSIQTKYLGATHSRGARIKATTSSGLSKTVSWDDGLDVTPNHDAACKALLDFLGWQGDWIGGASQDGKGEIYVQVPSDAFKAVAK